MRNPPYPRWRSAQRTSHVHSRGRRVRPLGDRIIHANPTPVDFHPGTTISRLFRIVHVLEIDKRKPTASSCRTVINDVDTAKRPISSKDLFQVFLSRIVGEIEDAETGAFWRRIAVSLVALPVGHGRTRSTTSTASGRATIAAAAVTAVTIAGARSREAASAVTRARARAPTTTVATAAPVAASAPLVIPAAASATALPRRATTLAATGTLLAALAPRRALFPRRRPLSRRSLARSVGIAVRRSWTRFAARHLFL